MANYEEDREVLGFINPVLDSDDKDDNIFEPESFFGVFNTFVNQCCVSLHLGSMLFPKFMKCWKLTHLKKFNF